MFVRTDSGLVLNLARVETLRLLDSVVTAARVRFVGGKEDDLDPDDTEKVLEAMGCAGPRQLAWSYQDDDAA